MSTSQEGTFSTSRKGYSRDEVDEYVADKERMLVDAAHRIETLEQRIAELEPAGSRIAQLEDDLARSQRRVNELEGKLDEVRSEAFSSAGDGSEDLEAAQRRIADLEAQIELLTDDDALQLAQRRIHELETQIATMADDDRLGHAMQRIEELEEQLATGGATEESVRIMLVEATKTRDALLAEAERLAAEARAEADAEGARIVEQAMAKAQDLVGRAKTEAEAEREASAAAAARLVDEATQRADAVRAETEAALAEREAELGAITAKYEEEHGELLNRLAHMRDAYAIFEERLRFFAESTIEEITREARGFEEFDLPDVSAAADPEAQARAAVAAIMAQIEQHPQGHVIAAPPAQTEPEAAAWPAAELPPDNGWEAAETGNAILDDQAASETGDGHQESEMPDVHDALAYEDAADEGLRSDVETTDQPVEFEAEAAEAEDHADEPPSVESDAQGAETETDNDGYDDGDPDEDLEDGDEPSGEGESFYTKRRSRLPRLGEQAAKDAVGGLNSLRSSFKD